MDRGAAERRAGEGEVKHVIVQILLGTIVLAGFILVYLVVKMGEK